MANLQRQVLEMLSHLKMIGGKGGKSQQFSRLPKFLFILLAEPLMPILKKPFFLRQASFNDPVG